MGGLFGSIRIPGNRLTDLVGQTSTVGRPIPFGYGMCRIEEPNVIWTAGIPKEHVRRKKQGKGGVKTEEYTYTLSYAIAFMSGPVYGYLTIKRGGKVVFTTDPNAPIEDKAFAAKWLQKARLYYGTEDQLPDPTIESYKGAGQVSAHRGLAYIVIKDDDVTAEGGAVPQYEAVIQATPPDVYLTSRPYPIEGQDGLMGRTSLAKGNVFEWPRDYMVAPLPTLVGGDIRDIRQYHTQDPQDFIAGELPILQAGEIRSVRKYYTLPPQEFVYAPTLPVLVSGSIKTVRLTYNHRPQDFLSGSLPVLTQGTIV